MPDGGQEIQETAPFHVNFKRYLRNIFSIIQWQAGILISDQKLYSKAPKFRQILPQSAKVTLFQDACQIRLVKDTPFISVFEGVTREAEGESNDWITCERRNANTKKHVVFPRSYTCTYLATIAFPANGSDLSENNSKSGYFGNMGFNPLLFCP